jgi:hypothetical protein
MTFHGNADDQVAALADEARQPGALGTEHDTDARGCQITELEQRLVGGVVEADDPHARVAQALERRRQARDDRDRQVFDSAGGLWISLIDPAPPTVSQD